MPDFADQFVRDKKLLLQGHSGMIALKDSLHITKDMVTCVLTTFQDKVVAGQKESLQEVARVVLLFLAYAFVWPVCAFM